MQEIELEVIETGHKTKFRLDHAENILNYENKPGRAKSWKLPTDSNHIFENGKLIPNPSDKANKGASKSEGVNKGDSKAS